MRKRAIGIATAVAGMTVALAGPASAAQEEFVLECAGTATTLRVNQSNSAENGGWSVAQVRSGSGKHLIPVTFAGVIRNETQDVTIDTFSVSKGRGKGNHKQATITCTESATGTWAEIAGEGEPLPDGSAADDQFSWTFTVTAVRK